MIEPVKRAVIARGGPWGGEGNRRGMNKGSTQAF